MLELVGELLGRHPVRLVEHQLGLGLEPPRVRVRLARLAGPDLRPVLVHLSHDPHDRRERLHAREVEDDPVAGLHLLGEVAAALLHAYDTEPVLARGLEVLRRAREDPGGHPLEG
jgi:hypothetical protein